MAHGGKIAILDDDAGVLAALTSLVRSLGFEARAYACAEDFLRDPDGDPDCLISDIEMPGLTGDALQVALIAAGRRIPMIFMTAFARPAVRERVLAAGAVAFLEKPVDGEAIAAHLAVVLARRDPPHTLV
jgi:FixJ family two-component response regulator